MKQILFVHCAGVQGPNQGSGDLVAWLRSALGEEYEVLTPSMPSPEAPSYPSWRDVIHDAMLSLTGETLLIGHSLGGSVLMKYLTDQSVTGNVSELYLMAAPFWGADSNWEAEEFALGNGFASQLDSIRNIFMYHSRDDDVVPFEHLHHYAQHLPKAAVRELDGYGHRFQTPCQMIVDDIQSA